MTTTTEAKTKTETKAEVKAGTKTDPRKNSRGRGKTKSEKTAENRKIYRKYIDIKKEAIEAEKHNNSQLILFPNSDIDTNEKGYDFFHMGGTSAILYVHEYSKKIGRENALLKEDNDVCKMDEKFKSGMTTIRGFDSFRTKMEGIGVKYAGGARGLHYFDLPKEYTRKETREMLKAIRAKREQLHALVYAKVLYPDIHKQILALKRLVPPKVKNMEKAYRELLGPAMIEPLLKIITTYSQMTYGYLDEMEGAKTLRAETAKMLSMISLFDETKIWNLAECTAVGQIVVNIQQLIEGRIINGKK